MTLVLCTGHDEQIGLYRSTTDHADTRIQKESCRSENAHMFRSPRSLEVFSLNLLGEQKGVKKE